ncbi:hypothetical protein [Paenimyroides aestuarii]|uniref:Uncharacterized protein n=1 Tax=Paenimyroides aestuarii TaxID=2968490 RepID=A0ABY5NPK4_9FLAO|nr:hypothetical protein [Paenimyroides aestuarii]UUV20483.1 hypothetical protein NPX36_08900 [Paenimyroides aestuarii]
MSKLKLLFILATIHISFGVFSQILIPNNYKVLEKSPANGRNMEKISIDLDQDNQKDIALIVQNTSEFADYKLLIFLTRLNKTFQLKLINEHDMNIYPVQMKSKKNVLEVGYFLDGTATFGRFFKLRFDEKKLKMRVIGYDSGYKIGMAEHCDKSFNLLTGDYVVKNQKSIPKNHIKIFKGKKNYPPIYLEDINIKTLEKLDKIGSEFEL